MSAAPILIPVWVVIVLVGMLVGSVTTGRWGHWALMCALWATVGMCAWCVWMLGEMLTYAM
jgi:hypothetical protein